MKTVRCVYAQWMSEAVHAVWHYASLGWNDKANDAWWYLQHRSNNYLCMLDDRDYEPQINLWRYRSDQQRGMKK